MLKVQRFASSKARRIFSPATPILSANYIPRHGPISVIRSMNVDWTFYSVLEQPGAMDGTAQALGARVVHSPTPLSRKSEFVRALRRELRAGDYDVLHCHHDLMSAVYLTAATGIPVRKKI